MSVMDIVFLLMIFACVGLPFLITAIAAAFMVYNEYKERKLWEKWCNKK